LLFGGAEVAVLEAKGPASSVSSRNSRSRDHLSASAWVAKRLHGDRARAAGAATARDAVGVALDDLDPRSSSMPVRSDR
jgi:hypothetical protein